jgi:hypothetical protein
MHRLSSVYWVITPVHVSGISATHHQEVECIYVVNGTSELSVSILSCIATLYNYTLIRLKHIRIITACNINVFLAEMSLLSKLPSSFPSVILSESTYCVSCMPNMVPLPAIPVSCQYTKNITAHFATGDQ